MKRASPPFWIVIETNYGVHAGAGSAAAAAVLEPAGFDLLRQCIASIMATKRCRRHCCRS
jgi:hypothetical protein